MTQTLKSIPDDFRIGALAAEDFERISMTRDYILETPEMEKIFGLKRQNTNTKENATFTEFLSELRSNPDNIYQFCMENDNYSLIGTAFHVAETGRDLAVGTIKYDDTEESLVFNLGLNYRNGYFDTLNKRFPTANTKIYFYQVEKVYENDYIDR